MTHRKQPPSPLLVALLMLSGAGCTSWIIGRDFRQMAARNLVARLNVERQCDDGPEREEGAAIFVAANDRAIYLATASHVVLDDGRHCKPKVQVRSHFRPEPISADLVLPAGEERPWQGLDFELLRIPRRDFGPRNPYLSMLQEGLKTDLPVQLYGAVHGYSPADPAQALISNASSLDTFALRPLAERAMQAHLPQPSDSGGGLFSAEDQGLVGLYTGGSTWNAIDIHRVIQHIESSQPAHLVPVELRRQRQRVWWGYATAGALGIVAAASYSHARRLRHDYYEDPTRAPGPVALYNKLAAVVGGLAVAALGYNVTSDALLWQEARAARQDWAR